MAKISKKDALMWFEFFAMLPEEEETPAVNSTRNVVTKKTTKKAADAE